MKPGTSACSHFSRERGDPVLCFAQWMATLQTSAALLVVDFELEQYWLEKAPSLALSAIYYWSGAVLKIAVTDRELHSENCSPKEQFKSWISAHGLPSFDPRQPIELQPKIIDKPWGQEIWYSGVEQRGVCDFGEISSNTPIPWLQAVLPNEAAGRAGEALVLLKVLAPSSKRVQGDLYFELHEKKREVYVVTHIDRRAWPDGVGYMRYGFDRRRLGQFPNEAAFRAAYLESVLNYEKQRRLLDALFEQGGEASASQITREEQLREHMEGFTHLQPLQEGDVVQVPTGLPHALQHGVRVVEFQTPTYERKILSFGQKVLTQDHWDTREAVAQMLLLPPAAAPTGLSTREVGVARDQIVDFPDFEVHRVCIQPGKSWRPAVQASYQLLIVIAGEMALEGLLYESERALLLPRHWQGSVAARDAAAPLVFLLARPRS